MKHIELPLTDEKIRDLKMGDEVLLSGSILVGRDQAHKRVCDLIDNNQELPVNINGEVIYYMGPSPAKEGDVIGACGPTTSSRMDAFAPKLMDVGLKGMIGKGPRYGDVLKSIIKNKAIYFYSFGGCGALYAQKVIKSDIVAFEDLGPEAIRRLVIKDFPVIVAIDSWGNNIYNRD
ncbi:Fe-S-containing hydro-lyase [Thiospirochaeta perfilievii]|uniref:Fe-S-containing hydro-lyase n=1 Tax=Thiospirochaeta perfilievii TaxID=252967 RepID=A0A5C1QD30_9SPIO|nr:Fe-S-containing hydro-lyase [Thiospirochaeta perfilievii]QEN04112.1 Fe-S-containing hydro-lyase [Thiospirochaeta perfilievii]